MGCRLERPGIQSGHLCTQPVALAIPEEASFDQALAPAQMAIDLDQLHRLSLIKDPSAIELVDLARLLLRYQGNPAAGAHNQQISQQLERWGLDQEQLFEKTRAIWASGFRPTIAAAEGVGSGADVSEG